MAAGKVNKSKGLLLATDLDRSVIPNGREPESEEARPLLARLARRPEICLVYVTGRHRKLIQDAILSYSLPVPDFAVGDVGASIHRVREGRWERIAEWEKRIGGDWGSTKAMDLEGPVKQAGGSGLTLQEPEKQGPYKLSFYTPPEADGAAARVKAKLAEMGLPAAVIVSRDEEKGMGLLDVLPESATKAHALRYLMKAVGIGEDSAVFAGDSGNDLPVLTSGLCSVLVKNAHPRVAEQARGVLAQKGLSERLYLARGGFLGMNGNYAAGVLEGFAHFHPRVTAWLAP